MLKTVTSKASCMSGAEGTIPKYKVQKNNRRDAGFLPYEGKDPVKKDLKNSELNRNNSTWSFPSQVALGLAVSKPSKP